MKKALAILALLLSPLLAKAGGPYEGFNPTYSSPGGVTSGGSITGCSANTALYTNSSTQIGCDSDFTFNGTTVTVTGISATSASVSGLSSLGTVSAGAITATSLTSSDLTSGRIAVGGTAGILQTHSGLSLNSSNYRVGIGTGTPTLSVALGTGLDIEGANAGIRLGITATEGWGFTEYLDESGVGKFISGYRDLSGTYNVRPGTSLGGSLGWSMNSLGTVSLGANPYSVFADLYELNVGTSRNSSSGIVIANSSSGASADSRIFLSNDAEAHGISLVQYGANYNTGAHSWADQDSGGLVAESQNDSLFLATNGASPIQFITNDVVRMLINAAGDISVTSSVTAGGFFTVPVATQTIAAGNTIAADQCGGTKRVSSAGAVTTDTTNSFTAQAATVQCQMKVCNVGANNITVDRNALTFTAAGVDAILLPDSCSEFVFEGGKWRQTTAVLAAN